MRYEEQTQQEYREQMVRLAKDAFASHELRQESPSQWYVGRPGSGFYSFRVLTPPGYVVLVGDIGDTILRVDRDSLAWLRGSCDFDYVLGKVSTPTEQVFLIGEADLYLAELLSEADDDEEYRNKLEALQGEWEWRRRYFDPDEIWEELWRPIGDAPDCTDWAPQHFWHYHALMLFRRLLAASEKAQASPQEGGSR